MKLPFFVLLCLLPTSIWAQPGTKFWQPPNLLPTFLEAQPTAFTHLMTSALEVKYQASAPEIALAINNHPFMPDIRKQLSVSQNGEVDPQQLADLEKVLNSITIKLLKSKVSLPEVNRLIELEFIEYVRNYLGEEKLRRLATSDIFSHDFVPSPYQRVLNFSAAFTEAEVKAEIKEIEKSWNRPHTEDDANNVARLSLAHKKQVMVQFTYLGYSQHQLATVPDPKARKLEPLTVQGVPQKMNFTLGEPWFYLTDQYPASAESNRLHAIRYSRIEL